MSFKDILSKLDQLSEGDVKHTGTYGNKYGKEDVRDQYGHKIGRRDLDKDTKKDEPKKGRGRPKKDVGDAGVKFDTSALSGAMGGGKKPKKEVGKTSVKHSLKEYFDSLDKALSEAEQIQIKPASQVSRMPGTAGQPQFGQKQTVAGQPQKNTQVIQQGNKTLGTVDNPQLAQQIKQSIGKGEMTLMPGEEMAEDGDYSAKRARAGKDIGKPGKQFSKIAKSAGEKYGSKAAGERVAGAVLAKLRSKTNEADMPQHDGDFGAGLGAGRSQGVLEAAKPDYIDLDKDGNKKETMKKAAKDAKDKKKVDESMNSRLKAAHHAGKAHALSKQGYNCTYDDMEESRMYHEGFKEGLDECYGQMPIQGYVGEENTTDVVDNMASFGAHDDVDEGNAFTAALKRTPAGEKFKVGGQTFTDRSSIEEANPFSVSESVAEWDKQLTSLLENKEDVSEGMSVSISKGQEGAPDSVSVTAQDQEADQLLQIIKQAGLGLFGSDDAGHTAQHANEPMTVDSGEPAEVGTGGTEIGVVDDHDDMMSLIKKLTGNEPQAGPEHGFGDEEGGEEDYEGEDGEEDHDHTDESTCESCGMTESECGCEEQVDEVESEDQQEYEVAEGTPQEAGAEEEAETSADENAEAQEDEAISKFDAAQDEEQVEEAYSNGADDTFEADIKFMTDIISSGLNKKKSTGQTTIPVIASQMNRQVAESGETPNDLARLAGIK